METTELIPHNSKPISDLDTEPTRDGSGCVGLVIAALAVSAAIGFVLA